MYWRLGEVRLGHQARRLLLPEQYLYFALEEPRCEISACKLRPKCNKTPAIWILEPNSLNERLQGESNILTLPFLTDYVSRSKGPTEKYSAAIYTPWSNRRLAIQQGRFTIHGSDRTCLESQAQAVSSSRPVRMVKIELNTENLDMFRKDLGLLGTSRLAIYPELANIAEKIWSEYN